MGEHFRIRYLMLDFGDVLIDIDWQRTADLLQISLDEFDDIRLSDEHDRYERDEINTREFFDFIHRKLKRPMSFEKINEAWCAVLGVPIPGIEEFIAKYNDQLKIFILSNTNRSHIEAALLKYEFLQSAQGVLTSFDLKARKPEAEIYERALLKIKAAPHEVLFIDDREDNVIGARACRIHAETCYRSVEQLEHIIQKYLDRI